MKLKHPFFCFQTTLYDSLMCLSRAKTMSRARGGGHTTPEKRKAKGWMLELHGRDRDWQNFNSTHKYILFDAYIYNVYIKHPG